MTKEDQERIERAAQERHEMDDQSSYQVFIMGAEYEHPISYNKGLEDGAGYFNKESFNEAIEQVIKELEKVDTVVDVTDATDLKYKILRKLDFSRKF